MGMRVCQIIDVYITCVTAGSGTLRWVIYEMDDTTVPRNVRSSFTNTPARKFGVNHTGCSRNRGFEGLC